MPVPLGAIALGAGLAKLGVDLSSNKKRRNKFEEAMKNRPEYEIPDATKNAYNTAQREYKYGEIPGMGELMDRIALGEANALETSKQSGDALGAVSSIQAGSRKAEADLGMANAQFRQSNLDRVLATSAAMAAAEDREFQMNEFAPWADRYKFDQEMVGASNRALTGGIDNLSSMFLLSGFDNKSIDPTEAIKNFIG